MYIIYTCNKCNKCNKQLNENTYDIKINLSNKQIISERYGLQSKGEYKEYWDNNVCIRFSKDETSFQYIEDVTISYNDKYNHLIQEINSRPCNPYNFFNTQCDEVYKLYESVNNDITVQMKEYQDYLTLNFVTDDFLNLKKRDIFYI